MSLRVISVMRYFGHNIINISPRVFWSRSLHVGSHDILFQASSTGRRINNLPTSAPFRVWRVGKDKYENLPVKEYLIASWKVDLRKMKRRGNIKRILDLSVKEDIRPRLEVLVEAGVDEENIGHIITREPSILLQNIPDLLIRLSTLKKFGIEREDIPTVIVRSPNVLTNRIEVTLSEKVEFLMGVPVKPTLTAEDITDMLLRCPELMTECSLEALTERVDLFTSTIIVNKLQLHNLFIRQPQILTFGHDALYEKYKYYREEMGLKKSHIARCPRALMCSLKRVKERYNYLKSKGILNEDQTMDDHGLGIIATFPDKQFADAVKCPLESYKDFVERFWKDEQRKAKSEREKRKKKKKITECDEEIINNEEQEVTDT